MNKEEEDGRRRRRLDKEVEYLERSEHVGAEIKPLQVVQLAQARNLAMESKRSQWSPRNKGIREEEDDVVHRKAPCE